MCIYRSFLTYNGVTSWLTYHKLKMYWIKLAYWTLQVSLTYLTCLRTPTVACSWAKSPKRLFYYQVLSISCNLLNTVLNMKQRMVIWVQTGWKGISCLPLTHCSYVTAAQQHHKTVLGPYTGPILDHIRKDPNSEFQVQFLLNGYYCHTIKSWRIVRWKLTIYLSIYLYDIL